MNPPRKGVTVVPTGVYPITNEEEMRLAHAPSGGLGRPDPSRHMDIGNATG